MIPLSEIPEFPPDISDASFAFGNSQYLPLFADLPDEYKSGSARGCKIASDLFYNGWSNFNPAKYYVNVEVELASPPPDYHYRNECTDVILRFQRCVTAELKSFKPKHEHKIAGVGYLIDKWITQK
jgi:hypothetical protein